MLRAGSLWKHPSLDSVNDPAQMKADGRSALSRRLTSLKQERQRVTEFSSNRYGGRNRPASRSECLPVSVCVGIGRSR